MILFGAGEFSQLISAYLPQVYERVSLIVVDSATGARSFDKPIVEMANIKLENKKILVGVHPNNADAVKHRLSARAVRSIDIFTLDIS